MRSFGTVATGFMMALLGACSDSSSPPAGCDRKLADGSCAGVSKPEICAGTYCTDQASCTRVWYVQQGAGAGGDGSEQRPLAALGDAAKQAAAQECIALADGSYLAASLKGGVSLLGRGAARVTITGDAAVPLSVTHGRGGLLRGFSVVSSSVGLVLQDAADLQVEEVRIEKVRGVGIDARTCTGLRLSNLLVKDVVLATARALDAGPADSRPPDAGHDLGRADALSDLGIDRGAIDRARDATPPPPAATDYGVGILLAKGSTAELTRCTVTGAGTQGVLVHGSTVALRQSAVTASGFYGVAIDCTPGCPAGSEVSGSLLEGNGGIGLLVMGGKLTARDTDIGQTTYRAGFARGLQAQGKAALVLERNRVHHGVGQGIVVDGASGTLLRNTIEENQERGVVLQQVAAPGLTLEENEIRANEWAGVTALGCNLVTIKGGRIAQTKKRTVISGSAAAAVGDGIQIATQSSLTLSGVRVEDNARVGVLIDSAKASISDTRVSGGEARVVVQNAQPADQKLANVTDPSGAPVSAEVPSKPYLLNTTCLVGTLPIPLP